MVNPSSTAGVTGEEEFAPALPKRGELHQSVREGLLREEDSLVRLVDSETEEVGALFEFGRSELFCMFPLDLKDSVSVSDDEHIV